MTSSTHSIRWIALIACAAATTAAVGCGGNKKSGSSSSVAPPSSSTPTPNTPPSVTPGVVNLNVKGHGTLGIVNDPFGGADTYLILRDDGKEYQVVNPADLKASKAAKNGRELTFEGTLALNVKTKHAAALDLTKFKFDLVLKPGFVFPKKPKTPKAVAWRIGYDMSAKGFWKETEAAMKDGMRPSSVTVNSYMRSWKKARFNSVWIGDGKAWKAHYGLSADAYQARAELYFHQGFQLESVEAYGKFPKERYVAVWVKNKTRKPQVTRHRMTESTYQKEFNRLGSMGYRVTCLSVIGSTKKKKRFAAAWIKDGKGGAGVHDKTRKEFGKALTAMAGKGLRAVSITRYGIEGPAGKHAAAFVDDSRHGRVHLAQSKKKLQETRGAYKDGNLPLTVVQYGSWLAKRYSTVWVRQKGAHYLPKAKTAKKKKGLFGSLQDLIAKAAAKAKAKSSASSSSSSKGPGSIIAKIFGKTSSSSSSSSSSSNGAAKVGFGINIGLGGK